MKKAKKNLLEALELGCIEERRFIKFFEKAISKIPYEQIRNQLLDMIESGKKHLELLESMIGGLTGGSSFSVSEAGGGARAGSIGNGLNFYNIRDAKRQRYFRYWEGIRLARKAESQGLGELLRQLSDKEYLHYQQLTDIVIKLNPIPDI